MSRLFHASPAILVTTFIIGGGLLALSGWVS